MDQLLLVLIPTGELMLYNFLLSQSIYPTPILPALQPHQDLLQSPDCQLLATLSDSSYL
jgi:hypothetical protein